MDEQFLYDLRQQGQFYTVFNEVDPVIDACVSALREKTSTASVLEEKHGLDLSDTLGVLLLFSCIHFEQFDPYSELRHLFHRISLDHRNSLGGHLGRVAEYFHYRSFSIFFEVSSMASLVPMVVKMLFELENKTNLASFADLIQEKRDFFFSVIFSTDGNIYGSHNIAADFYSRYNRGKAARLEQYDDTRKTFKTRPVRRFRQRVINNYDTYSYYGSMPIPSELCRLVADVPYEKVSSGKTDPVQSYTSDPFQLISNMAKYDYISGRMLRMGQANDRVPEMDIELNFIIISPIAGMYEKEAVSPLPLFLAHFISDYIPHLTSLSLRIFRGNELDGFREDSYTSDDLPLQEGVFLTRDEFNSYFLADKPGEKISFKKLKNMLHLKHYHVIDIERKPGVSLKKMGVLLGSSFCSSRISFDGSQVKYFSPGNSTRVRSLRLYNKSGKDLSDEFYKLLSGMSKQFLLTEKKAYV